MERNLPLSSDSTTQVGSLAQITNEAFELFAINYPFWNHNLTPDQVIAKKRLWANRLQRFTAEQINEAMDEAIATIGDKSGPTMEQFLGIAHSLRRQRKRTDENDRIAHEKGYESWDALCRDQQIGIYQHTGRDLV